MQFIYSILFITAMPVLAGDLDGVYQSQGVSCATGNWKWKEEPYWPIYNKEVSSTAFKSNLEISGNRFKTQSPVIGHKGAGVGGFEFKYRVAMHGKIEFLKGTEVFLTNNELYCHESEDLNTCINACMETKVGDLARDILVQEMAIQKLRSKLKAVEEKLTDSSLPSEERAKLEERKVLLEREIEEDLGYLKAKHDDLKAANDVCNEMAKTRRLPFHSGDDGTKVGAYAGHVSSISKDGNTLYAYFAGGNSGGCENPDGAIHFRMVEKFVKISN